MKKLPILLLIIFLGFVIVNAFITFSGTMPQIVNTTTPQGPVRVVSEESVIIDAVKKASPAVVTVSMTQAQPAGIVYQINPFNPFAPIIPLPGGSTQNTQQNIGSGFIVDRNGFIVTNKHVVSDTTATYSIITNENKTYPVTKIYRDPNNDLAVLKIGASNLPTVQLGNSNTIQVGQLAIAIGTALGQFRSTVTTGVVSGVGRGITAGDPYAGAAEQLDNVIQTSAAINPGNSGGPLLNSAAQVIGINVAVSAQGQNIGFALPVNVVKDALTNFDKTGQLQ